MAGEKVGFWNKIKQNLKNLTNVISGDKSKRPLGLPAPRAQKYQLTNETFQIQTGTTPITLHRIKALKNMEWNHPYEKPYRVKKGDLGGFVESLDNLDDDMNCWIAENAMAFGKAVVKENALVRGQASVSGYAVVSGNSLVRDLVIVKDFANVTGTAVVYEAITIEDETIIRGDVYVSGDERVRINKDSRYTVIE